MIILSGTVTMSEQDLGVIHNAAIAMMEATRQEEGCLEYEFSEVIGQPGVMRIWERWESSDALDMHFAADHMQTWRDALQQVTVESRELVRYEGIDAIIAL